MLPASGVERVSFGAVRNEVQDYILDRWVRGVGGVEKMGAKIMGRLVVGGN